MKSIFSQCLVQLAVALALAISCAAQTAQINGRLTDPSGSVVPGAEVSVRNINTGVATTTETNGLGYYTILFLPPGGYELSVKKDGFRPLTRSGIRLEVQQVVRLDFVLELGPVNQRVQVTGEAPLVESETSSMGEVVNNKAIVEMPLNGRNLWDLVNLTSGSVYLRARGDAGEQPEVSILGSRSMSQQFFIDGGTVNGSNLGQGQGLNILAPMVDSVQEFKIITNNYPAEFGLSGGGVFTSVTKSGTNEFHGDLFEFLRNDHLRARYFFATTKPPLKYNQFGGTVGGPIRKNKTFFFIGYEQTEQAREGTIIYTVPTSAQKNGDFSGLVNSKGGQIPIYNPFTTRTDPANPSKMIRDPFPGNQIPSSLFDPVGVKLASFYPNPNVIGDGPIVNNVNFNMPAYRRQIHATGKLDHVLSDSDRLTARFIYQQNLLPQSSQYPEAAASNQGPFGLSRLTDNRAQTLGGSWVHTFTPSVINELRYNYTAQGRDILHASVGGDWPNKLGIKGVPDLVFPIIWVGSYGAMGGIAPYRVFTGPLHEVWDSVTWSHGTHLVKAGFEMRYNGGTDEFITEPSGAFTFAQEGTGLQGAANTGDAFASELLGWVTTFTLNNTPAYTDHGYYYGGYLQDDWKVTPRLTLNLGVRYDVQPAPVIGGNYFSSFDPTKMNPVANVPGVVRFAGVDGESTSLYPTRWGNVAPRFGFAWRPFGGATTAVRGGFGIFYPLNGCSAPRLGYSVNVSRTSPDFGQTPVMLMKDGVAPYQLPGPEIRNDTFGVGGGVSYCNTSMSSPYSEQMNLNVQHQVKSILFEVGYVGNMAHHLNLGSVTVNQIPADRLFGTGTPQSRRPFPQFTAVNLSSPTFGNSTYNALSVKVEKRYKQGLQFVFNYVYSKFLDDAGFEDQYNRSIDKSLSTMDRANNANFSLIWDTPFGKGRKWLTTGPLSQVFGGWQLSLLGIWQSGPPLGFTTRVNNSNSFSSGAQRPNISGSPTLSGDSRSRLNWFDTSVFSQPDPYTFGNAARTYSTRAPATITHNMGIMKNFPIMERFRLQFRAEMFNAFNHTNYGAPSTSFGSPTFGIISSAAEAREIQLALKLYF